MATAAPSAHPSRTGSSPCPWRTSRRSPKSSRLPAACAKCMPFSAPCGAATWTCWSPTKRPPGKCWRAPSPCTAPRQPREQASPTGLPARGAGVAIPHGDPDLVLAPAIGFAKLARPVAFREMGNPGATVSVELVFMLALQEAASHLRVLQQLVELIRDEGTLLRLKAAREPAESAALLAPVAGGG